ncbi:MAG TPA: zinc ribbon domain-containing protein [Pyrinomonadaceae bacterium]|nr:zinc ribbon domain-containing protein [Pyrinomonadaceae bacterium]
MYCPRCGHQSTSDALRFCSYCGFKLGVVKASLADEDETATGSAFTIWEIPREPRQRDINIGVILMFAGAMLATLLAGRDLGREGGALILAISFASLLMLSRPLLKIIYKLLSWEEPPAHSISWNQRGMVFGSILMFASTIVLAISSLLMFGRMQTPQLLFGLVAAFVLLLVLSKHLMRAVRYLVAGDVVLPQTDVVHNPAAVTAAGPGPALTAGQNVPASLFTAQRVTTAELASPASVTEHTTNLLENK